MHHKMIYYSKKGMAIVLAVLLIATSLFSIGVNAFLSPIQGAETQEQELQVAVLSEPRIFPQSLIQHGPAFNEVVSSDIAMLSESQAILDAAISEIIRQAPDVLLVPGNLTREGEVIAHMHLAASLNQLKLALPDINIYVINGSRDIDNPNARSFASGVPVLAPSVSPEGFRNIYINLGYGDATSVYFTPSSGQAGANSYVARPAPGFSVIAIDTASGGIDAELLNWITEQAQAANSRGDTVIAFMHHSLLPHSSIQATHFAGTLLDGHEYVSAAFAEAGIRYVFTSAMRATNIAQATIGGNTITDIGTASLTAFPSPIRFANFVRGVNAENKMTETVEISTSRIQSINYIDPQTGQNITNLSEHGSRMVTPDVVVSLILDSGIYDIMHATLDEIEAAEFVNTRGVRHTGLRAVLESALPIEDEYGNPLSNCLEDVFINLLREMLPTTEAEAMDLGGIGMLWYEIPQNRIRIRLLGGFAGNVFMTDANIRTHLINPAFTQLNNNLIVDRTIINEAIDQLGHDLLAMNVYPLPQPDGEGGYTDAGNQHTLFDLVRHAYLTHLAGDEQAEQWMLDVIDHLNDGGPLLDSVVDLVLLSIGVALDEVLHTVTINTSALVTSDLLGTAGRLAVIAFLGNNLGSIMSGFGFCAVEMVGEFGSILSEEELEDLATVFTNTFLGLLVNYGYPRDNFTTLHWVGDEVTPQVDRAALRALILEAVGLNQEDYTPESWAVLAAALSAANGVYNIEDATQEQIDYATANLRQAIDNLEEAVIPVDRDALRALIAETVGLNQEDYTPESWAAFQATLSAAQTVYNNEHATQDQVDVAATNLRQAIDNLEEAVIPVDRDALRALITEAAGLNQEDYTPESWATFQATLSAAQGVYNNENATQDQVDVAATNLRQAIDNLEEAVIPVDRDALRALIAEAVGLNQEDYTPESWVAFQATLSAAQTVYNNENATQDQVDVAATNLRQAIDNLEEAVIPVDRDALRALIAEAAGLNQEDYTPESWAALQATLSAAQGVYNNENATQDQVDVAATNLRQAIDNLEEAVIPVDRDALRALIAEAAGLNQEDYTPESWAALQATLSAAQGVYNNENATQDQVDVAATNLRQAIDNLVELCSDCNRYPCECPELCADCNRYPCECPELCVDCNRYPCECPELCADCNRYPCECPELCVDCNRYPCECVEIDRTALGLLIIEAAGLNEEDFTPISWSALQATLSAAQTVYNNENATQDQIDVATTNLRQAIDNLVEVCADCNRYPCECPELCDDCNRYPCECIEIDRDALRALILEAVGLNQEDYTPESWAVLSAALSAAHGVYNIEDATQEQIDYAATNLRQAIDNLVEVCDDCSRYPCECPELCVDCNRYPCECPELCDDCNRYPCECPELCVDCNRYPCECPELCADCNRYPCECPELCDDCNRYPCECVEIDRTALGLLIIEAAGLNEGDFTPVSWSALQATLSAAQTVYNNENATQDQIDVATTNLRQAIDNLVEVCVDCSRYPCECPELCVDCNRYPCECPELCDDCNRYPCECPELCVDCNRYPCECPELCADCNRYPCECPEVCDDCGRYPCECIEIDRDALRALILEAVGLNQEDYTPESWAVLSAALSAAHGVYNIEDATQEQIDYAATNLRQAIDNLVEVCDECSRYPCECPELCDDCNRYPCECPELCADCNRYPCECPELCADCNRYPCECPELCVDCNRYPCECVTIDRTALGLLIMEATGLNEGDFTPVSWSALQATLSAAQTVYNNENATQDQIDVATTNLRQAIDNLVEVCDDCSRYPCECPELCVDCNRYPCECPELCADCNRYPCECPELCVDCNRYPCECPELCADCNRYPCECPELCDDCNRYPCECPELCADCNRYPCECPEPCIDCNRYPCECPELCDDCNRYPCECPELCVDCNRYPCECVEIDRTALGLLIIEATGLNEEDFTPVSWSALQATLSAAQTVYNNENATQDQIDVATTNLRQAIDNLVEVCADCSRYPCECPELCVDCNRYPCECVEIDRTALGLLIIEAAGLNQEDFTPVSWSALQATLSAAQTVYNNENATQDQIDVATTNLRQAIDNLVEVCDDCSRYPCECPELCVDCNRYPCECPELCVDCNRYPCECPELCADCNRYPCECPELCADCNRYPCECPELCVDCSRYPCECIEIDRDALRALILEAVGLNQEDYTPESWAVLSAALSAAHGVYNIEDATQEQIDYAATNLRQAIDNLVEVCDDCSRYPCECPELCADCNRYPCECPELCDDCNRYPCECPELCADCNRYPCECPEQCGDCNRYPCECVEIDRTALGLLFIEAAGLNEGDFTPVSWSALQATLSAAQTVYNNENATQDQIDVATTNLRQAIDNLVEVCDDCSRYPCECPELCADCNRYPCECPELCADCNRYPCECPEVCDECGRYPCECPELCDECGRYPCECPELCADCNRYPCECPELCVDCNRYPCECSELCADCNRYPCECLELCIDCNRYPCECPELCDDCNKYPCECLEVDRTALSLLIAAAEIRLEENYTVSSWAAFIEALEAALAVYEDVDATQEEIDLAKQALIYAKNGLIDATIPPVPCEDCEEYPCNCPEVCDDCERYPCTCPEVCDDCERYPCNCPEVCDDCERYPCNCPAVCDDCERYPCNCPELCDDCNKHPCNCPEVCDDCNRHPCNCPQLCDDCNRHPCNCPHLCGDCNRHPCNCPEVCNDCRRHPCNCPDVCDDCRRHPCNCPAVCCECRGHPCNCPAVCRDCRRHPCRCKADDNRRPGRQDKQPVPKTGDNANMNLWMMLFTLGLFGFVATSTKLTVNTTKEGHKSS